MIIHELRRNGEIKVCCLNCVLKNTSPLRGLLLIALNYGEFMSF
ncbi:putative orphan protein [Pseudoalteromonas translucida]|uniref:Orphan protein n=1 Tax=Pseudoalteromonas translucida (strain TAC 125) TaxID=326442 RepID=Q3ICH6_PSET1|nr:putative orphan protein [Pseudoalteromonas translucida]